MSYGMQLARTPNGRNFTLLQIKRAMCLPSFFPAAILFCSALRLNNDMDVEKIIAQLNKSILQTRNVLNPAQYFKSQ